MKAIRDLTKRQLQEVVKRIVCVLYLDDDGTGVELWNPEKSWDLEEEIEASVIPVLEEYGLVPTEFIEVGDELMLGEAET